MRRRRAEVAAIFPGTRNAGLLDYVACWYRKAADYMAGHPAIRAAFVSTNSITQGEQAGVLWPDLFRRGVRINFAHRTFQWSSEARGKAAVHCVIVGFALQDEPEKWLFDYDTPKSEPHAIRASHINPYLVDGRERGAGQPPVSRFAPCRPSASATSPIDGGHYLFTAEEKAALLKREPQAEPVVAALVGRG